MAGPEEMLFYPEGESVADFIGAPNILDCDHSRDLGQGIVEVTCGGLKLTVPHEGGPIRKVAILPRHIYVSRTRPPGLSVNGFQGTVTAIKPSGNTVRIWVEVAGSNLMAEIPAYHLRGNGPGGGQRGLPDTEDEKDKGLREKSEMKDQILLGADFFIFDLRL